MSCWVHLKIQNWNKDIPSPWLYCCLEDSQSRHAFLESWNYIKYCMIYTYRHWVVNILFSLASQGYIWLTLYSFKWQHCEGLTFWRLLCLTVPVHTYGVVSQHEFVVPSRAFLLPNAWESVKVPNRLLSDGFYLRSERQSSTWYMYVIHLRYLCWASSTWYVIHLRYLCWASSTWYVIIHLIDIIFMLSIQYLVGYSPLRKRYWLTTSGSGLSPARFIVKQCSLGRG